MALRGALVVLVMLLLILATAWAAQRKLIYFPDRAAPRPAANASEITLRTADGLRLSAWLFKPLSGTRDSGLSVLVAPGNAGNREGRAPLAEALAGLGLTVLLLDYRGYGGNPGSPTEQGLAHDADAARAYLAEQVRRPILYFGESLGAGVVTALAVRHPPAGLLLRSPFTELAAAGREHYPFLPVRALLRDRFPVAALVAEVSAPTVVVYGTADQVVPAHQSRAVAESAANLIQLVAVNGAGHNDRTLLDGPELISAMATLVTHATTRG